MSVLKQKSLQGCTSPGVSASGAWRSLDLDRQPIHITGQEAPHVACRKLASVIRCQQHTSALALRLVVAYFGSNRDRRELFHRASVGNTDTLSGQAQRVIDRCHNFTSDVSKATSSVLTITSLTRSITPFTASLMARTRGLIAAMQMF